MKTNWTEIASELNYSIKNYAGLTKQIVQVTNRAYAYGIDPKNEELINGKHDKSGKMKMQGLESLKGIAARRINRVLKDFPIWEEWLVNVPGIGPAIGGQLVSLYYFKSVPICPKCGADLENFDCPICRTAAKGQGVLKYRIELREYPTISSWWHYMGRHNDKTGKMPKFRKLNPGEDAADRDVWNSTGRKVGFDIKESFNKFASSHNYKAYAEKRKRYRANTHPDATLGHRHNMAWNETVKLFLAHFWQVAHILDGLEMTQPWCVQFGGHDEKAIIPPYYFNGNYQPEIE